MIVTSITIVAGKATITASARFPLATCVHERTTLSSTAKRTRLCHPLDKLVTLLYLRRIFFLRRGGCGCSRNKRKPIIRQGGWWITKNEMKETGRILFFFFYLVDTKNVRISRKKSETIRQGIFERIKDMIFEKKNKENSREIAHLARYTKDIWTIIVESIVIDDFREIKQLEKEHPFHFRRKITRSKRRRRIRKSKLWKIIDELRKLELEKFHRSSPLPISYQNRADNRYRDRNLPKGWNSRLYQHRRSAITFHQPRSLLFERVISVAIIRAEREREVVICK